MRNSRDLTALMAAAQTGNHLTVRLLLKHGALVGLQDADGYTAIFHAIANHHQATAHVLLEHAAATAEYNASTPGLVALVQQALEDELTSEATLHLLFSSSIDLPLNEDNDTALIIAACRNSSASVFSLLAAGARTEERNAYGNTVFLSVITTHQF